MKTVARIIVAGLLALLARLVLAKYRPHIVMVTGSVGKTSTKDAAAAALSGTFFLRASEKSYNSEFGVPLTIIGAKNPWTNPFAWLRVFVEAIALILLPNQYPQLLVLEVGADRPGDLWKILRIATPDAVVVTRLPEIPVHVEAYASAEAVREEEFAPAYTLPENAPLIVSSDDEHALRLAGALSVHLITFGNAEDADVRIDSVYPCVKNNMPCGMEAAVTVNSKKEVVRVRNAVGRSQVLPPVAALALSFTLGLSVKEALAGLARYEPPPGRGRTLPGIKGSLLIDDSYNASPAAVEEIITSLSDLSSHRKIAVLGDMLELGRYSAEEHARIGKLAAENADVVVAVGERSRSLADAARSAGKAEIHHYLTSGEAAAALPAIIRERDIVLIKGSQSIRMERIVEALLVDPGDRYALVRQEPQWKSR